MVYKWLKSTQPHHWQRIAAALSRLQPCALPALRRPRRHPPRPVQRLPGRPALARHALQRLRPAAAGGGPHLPTLPAPRAGLRAGRGAVALRLSPRYPDQALQAPGRLAAGPPARRAARRTPAARLAGRPAPPRSAAAGAAVRTAPAPARLQPERPAGALAGRGAAAAAARALAAARAGHPGPAGPRRRGAPAQPARRLRPGRGRGPSPGGMSRWSTTC